MLVFACLALVAVLGLSPAAQGPPQPVTWSVTLDPKADARAPGGRLTALVTAKIDEGWHVYSAQELPDGPRGLRIDLGRRRAGRGGRPDGQPGARARVRRGLLAGHRVLQGVGDVPRAARHREARRSRGRATIAFDISFQACDGRMCLPGKTVRVSAPVVVARPAKR